MSEQQIVVKGPNGASASLPAGATTQDALLAEIDDSEAQMGAKIRRHQLQKVPYQLIVGDAEMNEGTVSVRPRQGDASGAHGSGAAGQRRGVALDRFVADLAEEVAARR